MTDNEAIPPIEQPVEASPPTPNAQRPTPFRSGYVTLIGKPNVGKSTLLNHIVGQKVSIVSNKPQTTRRRVIGIAHGPGYEAAFIDTPGVHEAHTQLGKQMIEQAQMSLADINLVVYVADGAHHPGDLDKLIAKMVKASEVKVPIILCMNKMDLLKAEDVVRNVEAYTGLLGITEDDYMLTTATQGHNVDKLMDMIVSRLPVGDPIYDEDEFTDQSSRFLAAELVREKILIATRQEVPHSVAVMIEEWEDEGDLTRIGASILVEKVSQRGILIGKQGQFLKKIGTEARAEIEELLGHRVHLDLHVKVSEGWRMNPRILRELEYSE
ncbi:GTPase Era [Fimbriimonas ginsengisoli]|uniref:GTPase Era n=1 Tax=Fimbriimonas ginsengisoli Gsoil 348 TaxID=661478 RepID=A0A068NYM4_FIMGI|nr:GTPase Era [Fimbriimonas ginsengisoli]AIE87079.1 GTP-binding protein era [Fimbriimonas ginsengisoli Gsoil 348]